MRPTSPYQINSIESALTWMRERGLIVRKSTKDAETFANVQGYVLSEETRDVIGTSLIKMLNRAMTGKDSRRLTIRDAFITSTLIALVGSDRTRLSEDEMLFCTNVALSLLPYGKLEAAGIAGRSLRSLGRDRTLLSKVRSLLD